MAWGTALPPMAASSPVATEGFTRATRTGITTPPGPSQRAGTRGPGQIDTFWIVDVDGSIVIIGAMYRADTPTDRIQEMRAIAESATFEEH